MGSLDSCLSKGGCTQMWRGGVKMWFFYWALLQWWSVIFRKRFTTLVWSPFHHMPVKMPNDVRVVSTWSLVCLFISSILFLTFRAVKLIHYVVSHDNLFPSMQGITIKTTYVLTEVFCPRRQPGTFWMMSGQSGYLIEIDISSSDYTFPCTLFLCGDTSGWQNVMVHVMFINKFAWCSMHAFQKEQKLHVGDGKTQGFIGVLRLFALLLALPLYFALQNQLAKHMEKNKKHLSWTHLDTALKRKHVLKCLNLVNPQHCQGQIFQEISHRGFKGINGGISYSLSSRT